MDYSDSRGPDYMGLQNVEDLNRIESQLEYYTREMNRNLGEAAGWDAAPVFAPQMPPAEQPAQQQPIQQPAQQQKPVQQEPVQQQEPVKQEPVQQQESKPELDADTKDFMAQGYMMDPQCFGENSMRYGPRLIDFINDEHRDARTYASMAARAASSEARRTLRRISGEELGHERMFSTTYFIITGKRYTPGADARSERSDGSFAQQLRARYIAEINGAMEYRRFAQQVSDPCLRRMAEQTADDERRHAGEIMELLREQ